MRFRRAKSETDDLDFYHLATQGGMVNESYPVPSSRSGGWEGGEEPSESEQWLLAYKEKASPYGRGVKDLSDSWYGTFDGHNYGPIGAPYFEKSDPRWKQQRGMPWNYSTPWYGGGPHPIWPVPPSPQMSFQYNPDSIAWMSHPNYNVHDNIQPIGTGDRAGKPATPLPGSQVQTKNGGYAKSIEGYVAEHSLAPLMAPGVPFVPWQFEKHKNTDPPPGEAGAFRFRRQQEPGAEASKGASNAPTVVYDKNDPYRILYLNASSLSTEFPYDTTGNLASAPYSGFPSQWAWSPYPYGKAGDMPGTSGDPQPYSRFFWLRGEIPRTFPGLSNGGGRYLHGGALHPHLPKPPLMGRMSLISGNAGLLNTYQKNVLPGIAAMRAATMRPTTTENGGNAAIPQFDTGYAGLDGMRDHYHVAPVEPIPPPGMAGQTHGPSNTGVSGSPQ